MQKLLPSSAYSRLRNSNANIMCICVATSHVDELEIRTSSFLAIATWSRLLSRNDVAVLRVVGHGVQFSERRV
jgi:hypothetical protein